MKDGVPPHQRKSLCLQSGADFVATANNNLLPKGYPHELGYTWAPPTRYNRIVEMLTSGRKFDVDDFAHMQQDTVSLPARDFLAILKDWRPAESGETANVRTALLAWDCNVSMNSRATLIYEVWIEHLHRALLPRGIASTPLAPDILISELNRRADRDTLLDQTLESSLAEMRERLGPDEKEWTWGNLHKAYFRHPLGDASFDLPARSRPGDAYTVNATGGPNYSQTHGASYREIIDVSDWDRSVMTNVPGESGVPGDPHYGDLLDDWAKGKYHQMPFSRNAVAAAAEVRIVLSPANDQ